MISISILVLVIITGIAIIASLIAEYSRVLMMMQQNSYRHERYMRWLRNSGDTTSFIRIFGMVALFASMASFSNHILGFILIGLFSTASAIYLVTRKYKKPVVWTPRVRRIFGVMSMLSLLIIGSAFCVGLYTTGIEASLFYGIVAAMALYCGSHMIVLAAIIILSPVEMIINRRYYNEAAQILKSMPNLKVVGITGSYGKTSTKHFLHRILSEQYETLMTPGSYNTTLGVIRTVRELMKPYCEVFICEMGAKQVGDIKEICDLVHPHIGIVTAVGPQHLESFKTLENVQATKFELVDALPEDGLAIVNNDFQAIAERTVDNVKCERYGISNENAEYRATEIKYSVNGTDFKIIGPNIEEQFHTPLLGECNVSNLVAAVICAIKLGVAIAKIRQAVERIEPVEHRLSIKRTAGGITILDDAFNSNPSGSSMALDVLAMMNTGKRFIITPGMIELGEQQYELNRQFGEKIASSADVAIIVGEYNREAIIDGIKEAENQNLEIVEATSFTQAQQRMLLMAKSGDVVLYENDLPDTFK